MLYLDLYKKLKEAFDNATGDAAINDLSITIKKRNFISNNSEPQSASGFNDTAGNMKDPQLITDVNDNNITSNNSFEYYTVSNSSAEKSNGIIFLFHGLNEKRWDKYFPWAYKLAAQTGKTIVLFPLAFHMNRAPYAWSDFRLMNQLAIKRAGRVPNAETSCVNAAISERLEEKPQRFFLSGFRTYRDFCSLLKSIRKGIIKDISPDTGIDFFGYSIGAFFSLLLLMDNPFKELNNSRLLLFCGGAAFDSMQPVSRYIIDMRASNSLRNYFNEQLENKPVLEKRLEHYFGEVPIEGSHFQSLISQNHYKDLRSRRMSNISERINAITLTGDEVIPPAGVMGTLASKSGARINVMDFEYPYNHVTPFPVADKYKIEIDKSFNCVMDLAASFLV